MNRKFSALLAFLGLHATAFAQTDDFGMWYELGAEKKLSKQWSVGVEGEFRTRNNTKTADRWSAGISADYKIRKGVKASAGYQLLYDNNAEELTFTTGGDPKKWTPSYWGLRHRFNVSVAGSVGAGRFTIGLRERWQYTYRSEQEDKKYAFIYDDNDYLTSHRREAVKGKGKHILRSRLQVEYDIRQCKADPFVNVELFHGGNGLQKVRYQAGVDYQLQKSHVLSLTYRYQSVSGDDDNERNIHMLGLGYKYKF
jgi:hypothetical protein